MLLARYRVFAVIALAFASAALATPSGIQAVEVAPTKTSIYIGSVSMAMPAFVRRDDGFESTYVAKVFPYSFYNEDGTIRIDVSDAMLAKLQKGAPIEFHGRAERTGGGERRITGSATPDDPTQGKLKVRVRYSKRIELIFNTTYKLQLEPPLAPAPPLRQP